MHELGIAQDIVRIVQEHAQRNKARKVLCVFISIGKLSGVVPEALHFCLSVCTKGTSLESTEFKMGYIPAIVQCKGCLTHFDLLAHEFVCPSCKRSDWHIISGKELFIKEIEVI